MLLVGYKSCQAVYGQRDDCDINVCTLATVFYVRSHLGSHKLAAFQHLSNPKIPEKVLKPSTMLIWTPIALLSAEIVVDSSVLHGCLHG